MIFTVQGKSLSLAGLMNAKAKALLVVCHRVNLSKPVTLRATDSGVQNAWRSFETITRDGHHTCSNVFSESIKKDLMFYIIPVYGYNAPAKTGAGIGVLEKYKATHDAPSVFFCVLTFAHPFFSAAVIIRAACRVMVSWMGAEKSAPVTLYAGYANPVQLTTSEIGVSGGGINPQYKEAAIVATTPTQNPQFIWIIAAVRRDMTTIKAQIHHIAAPSERDARRSLARDHVCFFAGRIRLEVAHA
ncbi:host cell division inhibitor Icd-like protein [Klebsiella pneumoniae]